MVGLVTYYQVSVLRASWRQQPLASKNAEIQGLKDILNSANTEEDLEGTEMEDAQPLDAEPAPDAGAAEAAALLPAGAGAAEPAADGGEGMLAGSCAVRCFWLNSIRDAQCPCTCIMLAVCVSWSCAQGLVAPPPKATLHPPTPKTNTTKKEEVHSRLAGLGYASFHACIVSHALARWYPLPSRGRGAAASTCAAGNPDAAEGTLERPVPQPCLRVARRASLQAAHDNCSGVHMVCCEGGGPAFSCLHCSL